ncbi:MAG: BtrH N-terminal domain-containing protein [Candidatus Bathyarchaeota archaeon]|nr:BtrH N-terminal domain-containing protein [Candidatus Bathyarchaeota archaeon]
MPKNGNAEIQPFENCPALDGYHCQTNSLAKIFHHYGHPFSEDMLLGLGSGMGFIYWEMKLGQQKYVFLGGRGNNKDFFTDLGKRTGVKIRSVSTSSAKKAQDALLEKLVRKEPVMVFGDMGFLPWFDLPADYHFGGHTFVVCGFDGTGRVLASDIDNKASGLKKGFYFPVSLEQLYKARGSPFKPFPPKNTYLEFDFRDSRQPKPADIFSAIKQTVDSQLSPPIKNLGVKGLRHASNEIAKWQNSFSDRDLRMNLFMLYVFFEIGGTGGVCFRYMYSRFLREAAQIVDNKALQEAAEMFDQSGKRFSETGLMFKAAETMGDAAEKIKIASQRFNEIADIEEKAFRCLRDNL